ncbi:hypothetical protein Tco_1530867 [Tanacetum coccineum]
MRFKVKDYCHGPDFLEHSYYNRLNRVGIILKWGHQDLPDHQSPDYVPGRRPTLTIYIPYVPEPEVPGVYALRIMSFPSYEVANRYLCCFHLLRVSHRDNIPESDPEEWRMRRIREDPADYPADIAR